MGGQKYTSVNYDRVFRINIHARCAQTFMNEFYWANESDFSLRLFWCKFFACINRRLRFQYFVTGGACVPRFICMHGTILPVCGLNPRLGADSAGKSSERSLAVYCRPASQTKRCVWPAMRCCGHTYVYHWHSIAWHAAAAATAYACGVVCRRRRRARPARDGILEPGV